MDGDREKERNEWTKKPCTLHWKLNAIVCTSTHILDVRYFKLSWKYTESSIKNQTEWASIVAYVRTNIYAHYF